MLDYRATPTGQKFLESDAFVKGICGPVGSGKSTVALMDLLQRAVLQEPFNGVRRTRFGLLRNTRAQLNLTVKKLIDEWFVTLTDGRMGAWFATDNTFVARFMLPDDTEVRSEFMLLAADTPDDVRRLLSVELSAAWVEESREVDPVVFDGLHGRVNRFPSRKSGGVTRPGVTFSTNPPVIGSFWHGLLTGSRAGVEVFMQPPALLADGALNPDAENLENLAPDYYQNLAPGKSEDWVNVYLRNQFGVGDAGMPVFRRAFRRAFHVAREPLRPVFEALYPLVVGMDNGLQAAASITQRDAWGRVNVLSECYVGNDETMGVESFLDYRLLPHLKQHYPQFPREKVLFVLDPACFQRSQVNEKTIAQAVQERGFRALKAPTNDPQERVQAVEGLLALQVDGGPALRLDPGCTYLAEALEWGYRYKRSGASGALTFDKSHHSHLAESLQYACLHYRQPAPGMGQTRQRREVRVAPYTYAAPAWLQRGVHAATMEMI